MPEQITVLSLSDVLGLRIECRKCNSSLSFPVTKERVKFPEVCPAGCGSSWDQFNNKLAVQTTLEALDAIRRDWEQLKPAFNVRFEVSLTNDAT